MSTRRNSIAILITLSLLALPACKDKNPTSPNPPTMSTIWPHADGNSWLYSMTFTDRQASAPVIVPVSSETELPSMQELHAALQVPLTGTPTLSASGTYELALDGILITGSGVTAQHVKETLALELDPPVAQESFTISDSPDNLLRAIARARPDLRAEIFAAKGWSDDQGVIVGAPTFIGGYAFAYEEDGYYGYGDLNQDHSFVYLTESLNVGTSFQLQLLPGFASDLWLYGQIWSRSTQQVGGKTYRNVIECMYVIDLGESVAVDENGNNIGLHRNYVSATTHFAPGVGPIRGRERWLAGSSNAIQGPQPRQVFEYSLELSSAALN